MPSRYSRSRKSNAPGRNNRRTASRARGSDSMARGSDSSARETLSRRDFLDLNANKPNNVTIGDYSIIGTGSYVHHDTNIGENCLIGGGTHIGAGVTVGDNVLFGIGSSVASKKISIGNNVVVASGSSILQDIPSNVLAIGNPAKFIKLK